MRCTLLLSIAAIVTFSCVPKNYTPVEQVPSLGSLKEVMDVQATAADPQFKKIDTAAFSEEDWSQLKELAKKIDATSKRAKAFSKGADFDALADRLNENASALGKAADAKDTPGASAALTSMKATCKDCHTKFR